MAEPENAPRAAVADPYATAVHQWWHLSQPPPELRRVLVERRLVPPG